MFKKILFAYDGSDHSKRAAKMVGELARLQKNTEICLVCVMESPPKSLKPPFIQEFIDAQNQAGTMFFGQARELIGKGAKIQDELLFGNPAENILKLADKKGCDVIVMGARGLSILEGLVLGSQVHKVLSHAKIPVLAVK